MKIIITITDQEIINGYKGVDPELVVADFCNDPRSWINGIEGTEVECSPEVK